MSAPQPRVYQLKSDWTVWKWECDCGVESREWGTWLFAQWEANKHSHKHAAERIAEELEHMARNNQREPKSQSTAQLSKKYRLGRAAGMNEAAELIRENLVRKP